MKGENYLWHIGRFHRAHMGQSIPWIVIGWIISLDILVYKYQPIQLNLLVLWISCIYPTSHQRTNMAQGRF